MSKKIAKLLSALTPGKDGSSKINTAEQFMPPVVIVTNENKPIVTGHTQKNKRKLSNTSNATNGTTPIVGLASEIQTQKVSKKKKLLMQIEEFGSNKSVGNSEALTVLTAELTQANSEIDVLSKVVGKTRIVNHAADNVSSSEKEIISTPTLLISLDANCSALYHQLKSPKYDLKKVRASLDFIIKDYQSDNDTTNLSMITAGIPRLLVDLVYKRETNKALLLKTLVVLNHMIASANDVNQFADLMKVGTKQFVKKLVFLVGNPDQNSEIHEQALWILDNIVQDFGPFRKWVLDANITEKLLKMLESVKLNISMVSGVTRLLSNLTYYDGLDPAASSDLIMRIVKAVCKIIASKKVNKTVTVNICQILAHLTDNNTATIDLIFSLEGVSKLVVNFIVANRKGNPTLLKAALEIVRNLCAGSAEQSKLLISYGLLDELRALVNYRRDDFIASTACAAAANLCGDDHVVIQSILDAGFMPILLNLVDKKSSVDVLMYARHAVMYIFHGASDSQTRQLLQQNVFKRVLALLPDDGNSILTSPRAVSLISEVLRCIFSVLTKFDFVVEFDRTSEMLDEMGGWQKIALLGLVSNEIVSTLARALDKDQLRDSVVKEQESIITQQTCV